MVGVWLAVDMEKSLWPTGSCQGRSTDLFKVWHRWNAINIPGKGALQPYMHLDSRLLFRDPLTDDSMISSIDPHHQVLKLRLTHRP